jgi:hypothetical protein
MLLQQRGIIMQQASFISHVTASNVNCSQSQAHRHASVRPSSPDLGAAFVASAVTLVIMMSGSSAPVAASPMGRRRRPSRNAR